MEYESSGTGGNASQRNGWAYVRGEVSSFGAHIGAYAVPFAASDGDITIVAARITKSWSTSTRFSTDFTELGICITAYSEYTYFDNEQDLQVALKDMTDSSTLLVADHLSMWPSQTLTYNVPVDPSHEYDLTISAWVDAWDANFWYMDVDVGISELGTPVPEPSRFIAGALLALPFGLQGVRYLRNRKK